MKIGVKFCGGCHVAYDRMEAYRMIREGLKDKAEFVSYEDKDADLTLVIMGCPSSCVDTEVFDQRALRTIKSPDDAEAFISEAGDLILRERI